MTSLVFISPRFFVSLSHDNYILSQNIGIFFQLLYTATWLNVIYRTVVAKDKILRSASDYLCLIFILIFPLMILAIGFAIIGL